MAAARLAGLPPGEILLEDFMKPMGISARQLAADIGVSPSRISELVNGQRPITADTALRLGIFFGMEPRFWLNLQSEYDMRIADRDLRAKLTTRIRVLQPVASWQPVLDTAPDRGARIDPPSQVPVADLH
ncbi:MAG: transcriptional regulator [Rubrivivax sp.]